MTTLLNKVFCRDISNLILCELERIKFNKVLTEMSETYRHVYHSTYYGYYTYFHKINNLKNKKIVRYDNNEIDHFITRVDVEFNGVYFEGAIEKGTRAKRVRHNVKLNDRYSTIYKYEYDTIGEAMDSFKNLSKLKH